MRAVLLTALILVAAAAAARADQPAEQKALVHYPVSTKSAQAQEFFDEGLTLVYAFNREEAQKRFRAAAAADSQLAIAWWGVALAAGPNLNYDMTAENWKTVREALGKAQASGTVASPEERRLIAALVKRYPDGAKDPSDGAYRDAIAAIHKDYPGDDDVATLYVESAMDADSWGFGADGSPIGDTAALVAILDGVIARNPGHPGANHYFVHLNDSTATAARALAAANRLSMLPVEPAASHLKHMSGHIYFDLGLFEPMQRDNRLAVDYDRAYAASLNRKPDSLDYYFHNLDFYTGASLMLDDAPNIDRATGFFAEFGTPDVPLILNRRQRYLDALAAIPSPKPDASPSWLVRWHYARGIADVSLGRLSAAEAEYAALHAAGAKATGYERGYFDAQAALLGARLAYARGDRSAAIDQLRALIKRIEPIPPEAFPASLYPAGEWLGWMLLESGDAAGAEAAFRADLVRTPHNARALYGLMQAFSAQDRTSAGDALALEIARNWRGPSADLRDRL